MIKRKKTLLVILILAMFIALPEVNAYKLNVQYADTGGTTTSNPREDTSVLMEDVSTATRQYTCTYNFDIDVTKDIYVNGYNADGQAIMTESLLTNKKDGILSGTYIKLNIYEEKIITWKVTKAEVTYTESGTTSTNIYQCTYTNSKKPQKPSGSVVEEIYSIMTFSRIQSIALNCSQHNTTVTGNNACPTRAGCNSKKTYLRTETNPYTTDSKTTTRYKAECEAEAAKAAKTSAGNYRGASYEITISDSNDINGTNTTTLEVTSKQIEKDEETTVGFEKYEYTYKTNRTCMNVKTSQVTYRKNECTTDEIEIKNTIKTETTDTTTIEITNKTEIKTKNEQTSKNLEYLHYFIPLNAKSNQPAEINLQPASSGNLKQSQCLYVMENHPVKEGKTSYVDLIVKMDDTNFKGDYYKGKDASYDLKEISKDGNVCKLTSKIKINSIQEFYNEIQKDKNNYTFKGFNFYYKPIDVNNPFPEDYTLATNSLWTEWKDSEEKEKEISESYDEITYIAAEISANKIREYNKDNPYTDWTKMYTTGVSSFIETQEMITRYADTDSFYKLGCGPLNEKEYLDESKTIKNPKYIEGCDSK